MNDDVDTQGSGAPPAAHASRPVGAERDRQVLRVVLIEGAANVAVLVAKVIVGFSTGSLAVLGDALHSLTDLANNFVAWFVVRLSAAPPDPKHPYGHRKFETLAVFGLASLMTVLGIELALGAIRREPQPIAADSWSLATMLCVLVVNIAVSLWEGSRARFLDSDILLADARHTLVDVLMTVVVIGGWQVAARGYPWLDSVFAVGVSLLVLYLAWGLFARAIPVLVDQAAIDPEAAMSVVQEVDGVRSVRSVRSRRAGSAATVDLVVTVDAHLSTSQAHDIADRIETALRGGLHAHDVTVHIEPEDTSSSG
ncbi:MAG TPA: cation diffusion facilitator family transporter [Myxococcota bacterium]